MKARVKNQPDFLSGIVFTVTGAVFVFGARSYEFGSAAQMGPAQFPMIVGGLLMLFGIIITLRSVAPSTVEEKVDTVSISPMLLVLGAVALFGLTLQWLGLILSSIALVVVSAVASHEFGWRYAVPTAIVLTLGCYLIFVFGLGLPMPVLPGGM